MSKRKNHKSPLTNNQGALSRRQLIKRSVSISTSLFSIPYLVACGSSNNMAKNAMQSDNLLQADKNGCRLPAGFSSRIVARSSEPVTPNSDFKWHAAPDGGACFDADDGWIYVSNSEINSEKGGASAIKFDQNGNVIDGYPILSNTTRNCAGGQTPYGTWLSCEENGDIGRVFECDPTGVRSAVECPALGYFNHEAVAYDSNNHTLYLTEDRGDGRLYRFTPARLTTQGYADLGSGTLEVAQIINKANTAVVVWHKIPDPLGVNKTTRQQVPQSTPFSGGEGITYRDGEVYFTTKGDNRVWAYNVVESSIRVVYEASSKDSMLRGVDNITHSAQGHLLVAEDGDDQQIVMVSANGSIRPFLQLVGHEDSEIAGPAFSSDQTRLYFSSQRGTTGDSEDGITYEITGPFSDIYHIT